MNKIEAVGILITFAMAFSFVNRDAALSVIKKVAEVGIGRIGK